MGLSIKSSPTARNDKGACGGGRESEQRAPVELYVSPRCCLEQNGFCCCMLHSLCLLLPRWRKRILAVGDSYVCCMMPKSGELGKVLLFDEAFRFQPVGSRELIVSNWSETRLRLRFKQETGRSEMIEHIQAALATAVGQNWLQVPKPHASTFPLRHSGNHAEWFVDARQYWERLADSIEKAREEIFIAAWWLSPEVYLRRPAPLTDPDDSSQSHWRLDQTLLRAAERGIHIYVLHYQAVRFSFGINFRHCKQHLEALHPNIRVLGHPEHELVDTDQSGAWFWTNHEKLVVVDQAIAFVGGIDLCFGRWDDERHLLTDAPHSPPAVGEQPGQLWPGKDYANLYERDFVDIEKPFEDSVERQKVVRMPWHDIHSAVYGEAAGDVARHFLQRWNEAKTEVGKLRSDPRYPYLLPNPSPHFDVLSTSPSQQHKVEVQVLRSAAQWSTGVRRVEESVYTAYIQLIEHARHCVYIENPFFVSNPLPAEGRGEGQRKEEVRAVENGVAHALVNRIVRAKERGETFRLYVMLPLLPAFEGRDQLGESNSPLQAILHYTYASISRGPNSLLGQLRERGVDNWRNYVSFCSARAWTHTAEGIGGGGWPPVSEIVYIHSKLMIVDDEWTLVGSANLNDRSLLGERDSEVCLLIRDLQSPNNTMGAAGGYAHSLRTHLMKEYLGLLSPRRQNGAGDGESIDVSDPLADSFFHGVWNRCAKANTRIYEEVFHAYPTDRVRSFDELRAWKDEEPRLRKPDEEARKKLDCLTGSLVEFPTEFLCDEDLAPTMAGAIVPTRLFT